MLAKDRFDGKKHIIGDSKTFGVDTICGIEYVEGEYSLVEGFYPDSTCEKCFLEVDKDLHKRHHKVSKNQTVGKKEIFGL